MATASTPRPTSRVGVGEPGFALGLAGFITSFVAGPVGLILSAIGLSQSKRIGKGNTFGLAGLIIGIVQTALSLIGIAAFVVGAVLLASYCNDNPDQCRADYQYDSSYYDDDYYRSPDDSYQDQTR